MNQKGFTNILLIVLAVILAGALGYVTLVQKPESTSQLTLPPPTIQPPPTQQTPPPAQIENKNPSATILFPHGGETLEGGKIYTIHWRTENVSPSATVQIGYGDTRSIVYGCCQNKVPNTGSAQLKTPEKINGPECTNAKAEDIVSVSYQVGLLVKESPSGPFVVEQYSKPFILKTNCYILP